MYLTRVEPSEQMATRAVKSRIMCAVHILFRARVPTNLYLCYSLFHFVVHYLHIHVYSPSLSLSPLLRAAIGVPFSSSRSKHQNVSLDSDEDRLLLLLLLVHIVSASRFAKHHL